MGTPQDWTKVGEPRVLASKFGKTLFEQDFRNPHNGQTETFSLLQQKDWSVVLAITVDRQVLVVRQYKQGCCSIIDELPVGTADFKDESPIEVMERELLEETGYEATAVVELGFGWMSTRNSPTQAHLFLATGCRKVREAKLDTSEVIETQLIPLADWLAMVQTGEITEWSAVMATLLALPYLGYQIKLA